jgi:hypothetical protein
MNERVIIDTIKGNEQADYVKTAELIQKHSKNINELKPIGEH